MAERYSSTKRSQRNLELDGDSIEYTPEKEPDLAVFKKELQGAQSDISDYYQRTERAVDYWHCRWANQWDDGFKWSPMGSQADVRVWPWEGASDTRVGLVAKLVNRFGALFRYSWMNAHLQARSTRPLASGRESERMTELMNWMLYTHMLEEVQFELPLLMNWRNAIGASVLWTDWEQERRVDYIDISMDMLEQMASQGQNGQGPDPMMSYIISAIDDTSQDSELIKLVQQLSPIVDTGKAKEILSNLRNTRNAQLPIPYVYKSKPRWTALRPMVDIFFPAATDDLQRARWIDRIEWVTCTELEDRIETAGYDPEFVEEAMKYKGQSSDEPFASRSRLSRQMMSGFGSGYSTYPIHDFDEKIELHHFLYKTLVDQVPSVYRSIFHMDCEIPAKHGPYGYKHGKYPCDSFRFEKHDRPILSSRGIAEIAYTWENEVKAQRDGRTDMVSLKLRPPMFVNHKDIMRIKTSFSPGVIFPNQRGQEPFFMPVDDRFSGSIEIEQTLNRMVDEYFPIFGTEIDPQLKQIYQQQAADDFLMEMKRPVMQVAQLLQQFLPDDKVAKVTGPLQRPFNLDREQIQGAFDFSMTVDLRELDNDWLKNTGNFIKELMTWDNAGVMDHTVIIRRFLERLDATLADEAIKSQESTTRKEQEDERRAIREIIGSGADVELPEGANYQMRLQVGQQYLDELMQNNPIVQKKLSSDPDLMKVLQTRMQYHQRQIQQQQNAQIGRIQVKPTFGKGAPMTAQPLQAES